MDHIIMSKKERTQLIVFEKLKNKEITQVVAACQLNITARWVRDKFKRYVSLGEAGLVHQKRNKPSSRKWNRRERARAIELLSTDWKGFGPTFAKEKLKERENILVSKETLRQAMIQEGLWQRKRSHYKQRKRRARRDMLGLMIQLDGSPHDWFESRAPDCRLLVFIDDATSKILWLEFVEGESSLPVMRATKNYIEHYGIPHSFYVDYGSVFSININNKEREKLTQWECAIKELGSEVIHARSPQAKGRVERANKTMQDRLIKEMRLAGISSIDAANHFVQQGDFLKKHNERFGVCAQILGDSHKPVTAYDLEKIFCIKEKRILANDYTIVHKKQIYQLLANQQALIRPKDIINISTHLSGRIRLHIRNIDLEFVHLENKPRKEAPEKTMNVLIPRKPHENSRRWASGLSPLYNSRRVG